MGDCDWNHGFNDEDSINCNSCTICNNFTRNINFQTGKLSPLRYPCEFFFDTNSYAHTNQRLSA
jgi:hypothetical protein